jgi:hypothetical protein
MQMTFRRSLLFVWLILALLSVVLLTAIPRVSFANEGPRRQLIERVEYAVEEYVLENDSEDAPLIPVTTYYVSEAYSVLLDTDDAMSNTDNHPLWTIHMRRNINAWRMSGNQCYMFQVRSGGQTETSICVDGEVYVRVRTRHSGGETSASVRTDNSWFCKNDTGWATVQNAILQGTADVRTRADHRVIHGGNVYFYGNEDGPWQSLPWIPQC